MEPADLERLLDRAVASLPTPPAPPTLLPGVMRAIALDAPVAARRRSWFEWSWPAKAASIAAVLLVVTGAIQWWPAMLEAVLTPGSTASSWPLVGSLRRVGAWLNAGVVLWRVVQPFAVAGVVLVTVMCAACAAFGAGLKSVVLGGSST